MAHNIIDKQSRETDRRDEARLFAQWHHERDVPARDELVHRYMPLARKLARRYSQTSEPLEDRVQVACVGLLKAINRFDPDRGLAFSSFAVPTMLGELRRHFRDTSRSIHLPRGLQELSLTVQAASVALEAKSGRSPTAQDLAQYLELDLEQVIEALEVLRTHRPVSFDAAIDAGRDTEVSTRHDLIGEEDEGYGLVEASASLTAAIGQLPADDRQVLTLRFERGLTQREIANVIGVSQMQVSRIMRRLTDELRTMMRIDEVGGHSRRAEH